MTPEAIIALCSLIILAVSGVLCLILKVIWSEIQKNRAETERNRTETAKQFSDQNLKLETNFRSLTDTATRNYEGLTTGQTRIEIQTTKTNGSVSSVTDRVDKLEQRVYRVTPKKAASR